MLSGFPIRDIPEVSGRSCLISLNCALSQFNDTAAMTNVFDLWDKAHDVYARARSISDESEKQEMLRLADSYLKQAEQIRRAYHGSRPFRPLGPSENLL